MAIQVTNEWNLQTPSNDVGSGLTAFTAGCWLKFLGNFTAASPEHLFFKFSPGAWDFACFNLNQLKMFITLASGGPVYQLGLQVGQPYFAVVTSTNGTQQFWLNGIQVGSGSVAQNTGSGNAVINIGTDSTVTGGVIIGQPFVCNYVLTSADIINLLNGTATPTSGLSAPRRSGARPWPAPPTRRRPTAMRGSTIPAPTATAARASTCCRRSIPAAASARRSMCRTSHSRRRSTWFLTSPRTAYFI